MEYLEQWLGSGQNYLHPKLYSLDYLKVRLRNWRGVFWAVLQSVCKFLHRYNSFLLLKNRDYLNHSILITLARNRKLGRLRYFRWNSVTSWSGCAITSRGVSHWGTKSEFWSTKCWMRRVVAWAGEVVLRFGNNRDLLLWSDPKKITLCIWCFSLTKTQETYI